MPSPSRSTSRRDSPIRCRQLARRILSDALIRQRTNSNPIASCTLAASLHTRTGLMVVIPLGIAITTLRTTYKEIKAVRPEQSCCH